jgi:protoporphyrinogen oxidase
VFYYPRKGFGQITEGFLGLAKKAGARFQLNSEVVAIEHVACKVVAVRYKTDGVEHRETADAIWSSLPINLLCRVMEPPPPPEVVEAAKAIRYRGMILIYLTLAQDQFTEYDAHYFPEAAIPMARMSEPKNYSATSEPKGKTILCAELPCDPHERFWTMDDDAIGREMCGWLASVGLPVTAKVLTTRTRRLGQAYPVYDRDFHTGFETMDAWIGGVEGLLTFGRQGLFAHDNTHHALAMAYAAAECLRPDGSFDQARWAEHRIVFESHVVED